MGLIMRGQIYRQDGQFLDIFNNFEVFMKERKHKKEHHKEEKKEEKHMRPGFSKKETEELRKMKKEHRV